MITWTQHLDRYKRRHHRWNCSDKKGVIAKISNGKYVAGRSDEKWIAAYESLQAAKLAYRKKYG
jgi:hypothetical protein